MNAERAAQVEQWLASLQSERHSGNVDAARLHIAAAEFWKSIKALPDSPYTDMTVCKFCDTLQLAFVSVRPV